MNPLLKKPISPMVFLLVLFFFIFLKMNLFVSGLFGTYQRTLRKDFEGEFNGQILESALVELNSESTLPPQIIIFGPHSRKYSF